MAVLDEEADRVGDVELALRVVRLQTLDRAPERVGAEHVDAGVDLADGELVVCRVPGLDDSGEAVALSDDPSVRAWVRRLEGENRCGSVRVAVLGEERVEDLRAQRGHVAVEDEHVALETVEGRARRANRVAGTEWRLLHGDRDALECVARVGRRDDDDRVGAGTGGRGGHPVDHAPAEQRMQVLRRCGVHPRTEATGHDDCCEL